MSLSADLQNLNLDPKNMGSWPVVIKIIFIVIVCVAVLAGGYFSLIEPKLKELDVAEQKEVKLKKSFEGKQSKAAALPQYKQQMVEIEDSFGVLLRQLPSKTEVADLLSEVSSVGALNGLNFKLFQPGGEKRSDFYAELPIQLNVAGEYHQFGRFVSDVAELPRIVTLHDFTISKGESGFSMSAQAKTYRYLDEGEIAAGNKKRKKGKRR